MSKSITVAMGDGIGPEIMKSCLDIMEKANANINLEFVQIGETVYNKGILTGIEDQTWESLFKNKIFFKAPISTPQGGGFKSLNVTVRKTLGLFANVRRCCSYFPFIKSKHSLFDVIIVRENEEDLYSGIEYRQTPEVFQCLKLYSRYGCERISEFAFEYAKLHGRKKITCFTKDNIMKMTDGLFHQSFKEKAKSYPDIQSEHWIIDIGSAKLTDSPENFDIIVTSNLYGDILSDIMAQISGSVGMGGSSNLGNDHAMFEAIHGSAPRRAGKDVANPSGLLMAGIDLLTYIEQPEVAQKIKNAWLKTIEEGIHTYDIYNSELSKKQVGTKEFTQAIIDRLGEEPQSLSKTKITSSKRVKPFIQTQKKQMKKTMVGIDLFFDCSTIHVTKLIPLLQKIESPMKLISINCRGLEVWPGPLPLLEMSDHWGLRFASDKQITNHDIFDLTKKIEEKNLSWIKSEGLFLFDGVPSFSGKYL